MTRIYYMDLSTLLNTTGLGLLLWVVYGKVVKTECRLGGRFMTRCTGKISLGASDAHTNLSALSHMSMSVISRVIGERMLLLLCLIIVFWIYSSRKFLTKNI